MDHEFLPWEDTPKARSLIANYLLAILIHSRGERNFLDSHDIHSKALCIVIIGS